MQNLSKCIFWQNRTLFEMMYFIFDYVIYDISIIAWYPELPFCFIAWIRFLKHGLFPSQRSVIGQQWSLDTGKVLFDAILDGVQRKRFITWRLWALLLYTHLRPFGPSMIIHWMSSDALKCFEFLQHILFEHVVGNYKFWFSSSHSLLVYVLFKNMNVNRWFLRAKSGAPWGWMVPQPTMLNGSFLVVPLQYGSQGQSCLDDFFVNDVWIENLHMQKLYIYIYMHDSIKCIKVWSHPSNIDLWGQMCEIKEPRSRKGAKLCSKFIEKQTKSKHSLANETLSVENGNEWKIPIA